MIGKMTKLDTGIPSTWCPGCYNFQILAGVKNFLSKQKDKWVIASGIG